MVTTPVEKEPSPSNTGEKLRPAFTLFQTPPAAVATYQIRLSVGWTAMSATRPEVSAGPIERNSRPFAMAANELESAAGLVCAARGAAGGGAAGGVVCAARGAAAVTARAMARESVRMGRNLRPGGMRRSEKKPNSNEPARVIASRLWRRSNPGRSRRPCGPRDDFCNGSLRPPDSGRRAFRGRAKAGQHRVDVPARIPRKTHYRGAHRDVVAAAADRIELVPITEEPSILFHDRDRIGGISVEPDELSRILERRRDRRRSGDAGCRPADREAPNPLPHLPVGAGLEVAEKNDGDVRRRKKVDGTFVSIDAPVPAGPRRVTGRAEQLPGDGAEGAPVERANEVQQIAGGGVHRPGSAKKAEVFVRVTRPRNGERTPLEPVRRRPTRHELLTGLVHRRRHGSRPEDAFQENGVERLVLDDLDHPCETGESGAAVELRRARLEEQAPRLDAFRDVGGAQVFGLLERRGHPMRHTGPVSQQIANGGMTTLRAVREPLEVIRHRRAQVETTVSDQQVDDRLGHDLGDRPHAEAGRRRAGHASLPVREAVGSLNDPVAPGNQHDSAEPAGRGFRFDQRIDARVERAIGGRSLREALGRRRHEQREDARDVNSSFGHGRLPGGYERWTRDGRRSLGGPGPGSSQQVIVGRLGGEVPGDRVVPAPAMTSAEAPWRMRPSRVTLSHDRSSATAGGPGAGGDGGACAGTIQLRSVRPAG